MKLKQLLIGAMILAGTADMSAQQLAFPGALGWGRYATGGRTGKVYHVTNLNDSGTGSLRDAVSQPNRIIVFDVAGVINIESRLVFKNNLYVAGQTAPGEGVTVYGNGVSFSGANNIIVRHMRFRMGSGGDSGKDCAGIANGTNMIFDHCSFAWGRDETFSVNWDSKGTAPSDITISNSIVGQGLLTHSAGGLMQGNKITLYRNMYCDNSTRNCKIKGTNQYVNNIVYNWKNGCYIMGGDSEGESFCNIESNLFINGPAKGGAAFSGGNANFHFYGDDNWQDSNIDGIFDPAVVTNYSASDKQAKPYDYPALEKWAGNTLIEKLLPTVGASLPYRDYTDCYMIDEVMTFGKKGELISTEKNLVYGTPNTWKVWKGNERMDSDKDGMPDTWEAVNGTDPNNDDAMVIAANGYANIENYINSISIESRDFFLRAPVCLEEEKATTTTVKINWRDYTDNEEGFTIELEKDGKYTEVAKVSEGTTEYVISGLEPGTVYHVHMRAYDSKGNYSDYSDVLKITSRPLEAGLVDIDTYVPELTWAGNVAVWDFGTKAWNNGEAAFADNKDILFSPTGDTQITLNEVVTPKTVVVNSDANITIDGEGGSIAGATSVNKGGEGTLTLNTMNTYTGATVLHGGVFEFNTLKNGGEPSAIGSSVNFAQNWVFNGGTYRYTGGSTATDRAGKLMRETELDIANSSAVVSMSGAFEGAGNLVIGGKGQVKVTDSKFFSYTGNTILKGGTLYTNNVDITKNFIAKTNKLVFAGGHFKTAGETEGYETYSIPMEVRENTVSQFSPNRNCYIASKITGTGTLMVNIPYLREYFNNGALNNFEGTLIANGTSSEKEGSLLLFNKGATTVKSIVELTGNARLCHWDTNATMAIGGISGSSTSYISGSSKNTKNFNCTWNVGGANTNETFRGKINNWACSGSGYSGTVNINKVGTGEWRLTGSNDYKGTTQIMGGTLIVNGTNSGKGAVTVYKNSTLKGKGTVAGKVTVKEGATVCAGDTTVVTSILKFTGGLTLDEGAIAQMPIAVNATTAKTNKIKVTGVLAVNGATLVIDMADVNTTIANDQAFSIFDLSGATVSGTGFTSIEPARPSATQVWDISELMTTGKLYVRNDASGIGGVIADEKNDNAPKYDLGGRMTQGDTKGLYIQNGKKYVNK